MGQERASLGFDDQLDQFDLTEWAPKPAKPARTRPAAEQTKQAAVAAGFQSREAKPATPTPPKQQRRRRTGRNVQFNIKARPETIEAFCAVADGQGWGLGETLEYAVALLEREYRSKS